MAESAVEREMTERVARALAPIAWAALGSGDTLAQKNRRAASLNHARRALEAMRESDIAFKQWVREQIQQEYDAERPPAALSESP